MNKHARALTRIGQQSRLPISKVCGEKVDRKRCSLFRAPTRRNGPQEGCMRGNQFSEGSPLHVPHDVLTVADTRSAELAAGYERRLWRSGISATRGHRIREIHAPRLDPDEFLACGRNRGWHITNLQDFRAAETGNDHRLHKESVAMTAPCGPSSPHALQAGIYFLQ